MTVFVLLWTLIKFTGKSPGLKVSWIEILYALFLWVLPILGYFYLIDVQLEMKCKDYGDKEPASIGKSLK